MSPKVLAAVMGPVFLCAGLVLIDRAGSQITSASPPPAKTAAVSPAAPQSSAALDESSLSADNDEDTESEDIKTAKRILGPGLNVPREILDMLEQRKRHLDRREATLRGSEERLSVLKSDIDELLTKYEKIAAAQKQRADEAQKLEASRKKDDKGISDPRTPAQIQLAKIYESMPAEEAAARVERMPERKAIELLRILKGKSAGAILASVTPQRAARLTEQLLLGR